MVRFYWRGTLTQPFAIKFFGGIWRRQPGKYLNKTVLVYENDVDAAFHILNRLMDREGLLKIIRNTRYYLKPYMQRNILSLQASTAILREDQERKMTFLLRKKRADSHPGWQMKQEQTYPLATKFANLAQIKRTYKAHLSVIPLKANSLIGLEDVRKMAVKHPKTKEELEELIANSGPKLVVIDFFATCPCRLMGPKFNKLAEEFSDPIYVGIDVDEQESIAASYDINVMPTFVFFKNGQKIQTIEGNNYEDLRKTVEQNK